MFFLNIFLNYNGVLCHKGISHIKPWLHRQSFQQNQFIVSFDLYPSVLIYVTISHVCVLPHVFTSFRNDTFPRGIILNASSLIHYS